MFKRFCGVGKASADSGENDVYKAGAAPTFPSSRWAQVAELADAVDSKSTSARIVGSTPTLGTIERGDFRSTQTRKKLLIVLEGSACENAACDAQKNHAVESPQSDVPLVE